MMLKRNGIKMKKHVFKTLDLIRKAYRNMWSMALINVVIMVALGLILGLEPIVIDLFIDAFDVEYFTFDNEILEKLLLLMVIIIANPILNSINTFFYQNYSKKMVINLEEVYYKKISEYPAELFEDVEFLDKMKMVDAGLLGVVYLINGILDGVCTYGVYFFVIYMFYSHLSLDLLVLPILIVIPMMCSKIAKAIFAKKLIEKSANEYRVADHYVNCLINSEFHKETRVRNLFEFFIEKYIRSIKKVNIQQEKYAKTQCKIDLICNTSSAIVFILAYLIIFNDMHSGVLSVGEASAVMMSLSLLYDMIQQFIKHVIGGGIENIAISSYFIDFLYEKAPNKVGHKNLDNYSLSVENLSFSYPQNDAEIIKNISFSIPEGSLVAIVGDNGAGKTTLVKLLAGIYSPSRGRVIYGDALKNRNTFPEISVVMQDFQRFKTSLLINVSPGKGDLEMKDKQQILNCLEQSGLKINDARFINGLDTILSRDFGETDLSTGQWQRIAIARSIFKKHQVLILDEPTSAIDPLEEDQLYRTFIKISKGHTTFVVTHKMAMAKEADIVIMMDKGTIVDIGSHQELYNRCNLYKEMYSTQKNGYIEEQAG